jgi:hypothetical protein
MATATKSEPSNDAIKLQYKRTRYGIRVKSKDMLPEKAIDVQYEARIDIQDSFLAHFSHCFGDVVLCKPSSTNEFLIVVISELSDFSMMSSFSSFSVSLTLTFTSAVVLVLHFNSVGYE